VIVRTGAADIAGDRGSIVVRAGQMVRLPGSGGEPYLVTQVPSRDDFDEFCAQREQQETQALASKHASSGVIGYEDLEDHGVWCGYLG
jgi:hypothetical protein